MIFALLLLAVGVGGGAWVAFGGKGNAKPKPEPVAGESTGGLRNLQNLHRSLVDFAETNVDVQRQEGLARKLEAAGSRVRPAEWIVTMVVVTIAVALVLAFLVHPLVGLVGAGFSLVGFRFALSRKMGKRQNAFSDQMVETLQLLCGGLRAGLSLQQALNVVSNEAPSPTGEEYRRVLAENRLGRDMTEALYAMADRIGGDDFEWVVGAIDINRHAGGDLAVILDRVIDTIRKRDRVRGQVKALSAEGKLSGMIMAALPPGLFVLISFINPGYVDGFTQNGIMGYLLLVVSATFLTVGYLWLRKMAKFTY